MAKKLRTRQQFEAAVFDNLGYFLDFIATHYPNIPGSDRLDIIMDAVAGGLKPKRKAHFTNFDPNLAAFRTWFCNWLRSVAGNWTRSAVRRTENERSLLEAWLNERLQQDGDNRLNGDDLQRAVYNLARLRKATDRRLPQNLVDPRHTKPEPVQLVPMDIYHELARRVRKQRVLSTAREDWYARSFQQRLQGVTEGMSGNDLVAMSVDHWIETIDAMSRFLSLSTAVMEALSKDELTMSPEVAKRLMPYFRDAGEIVKSWTEQGIIKKEDAE